ncbi:MAG: RNA polymerase sigma factor [Actinomycetota bacterium]
MSLPPFWTLVQNHGDELMRHAKRLVGDADAEDVMQEALLRALRSYPRLAHADHLRAWLYRVTTTTAYDLARRKKGEVPVEAVPERAEGVSYEDGSFEALIDRLSDGAKEAMRLRFVHDLAYEEIGRRLGCSAQAARQRVSTGVWELRKEMSWR